MSLPIYLKHNYVSKIKLGSPQLHLSRRFNLWEKRPGIRGYKIIS